MWYETLIEKIRQNISQTIRCKNVAKRAFWLKSNWIWAKSNCIWAESDYSWGKGDHTLVLWATTRQMGTPYLRFYIAVYYLLWRILSLFSVKRVIYTLYMDGLLISTTPIKQACHRFQHTSLFFMRLILLIHFTYTWPMLSKLSHPVSSFDKRNT